MKLNNKVNNLLSDLHSINHVLQDYKAKVDAYFITDGVPLEEKYEVLSKCAHIYLDCFDIYHYADAYIIERFMNDYMDVYNSDTTTVVAIVEALEKISDVSDMEEILEMQADNIVEIFNDLIIEFKEYCIENRFFNIKNNY